jgi:membrane protease YdiL (CAAX protease family)
MPAMVERYRRPLAFYGLATAIPWTLWALAGRISHIEPSTPLLTVAESALGFLGLLGPVIVAFALIAKDPVLKADLFERLFHVRSVRPLYWVLAGSLMLASILLATGLSLLLGYSPTQFQLAAHASFSFGPVPVWFLLILAPIIEELAWHSYGTDCLRSRFNLFATCMIFAVFWGLWHAPLALIKDYYQANLVHTGLLSTLNFPLSIIPFVLIMNWLYYKASRNIWIAVVFHVTAGYFNELFQTNPDTKVIQTGLLMIVAVFLVIRERDFFFERKQATEAAREPATAPLAQQ